MQSNPIETELRERTEERTALLRAAVNYTARQLLMVVPPMRRTKAESQLLYDCVKGRRSATDATLAALMDIQARTEATAHLLSDQLKAIEAATAPAFKDECLVEVGLAIEEADVALDRARTLYAKEQTPVRASVMWECLCQLARQIDRGIVQAARVMHLRRSPNSEAARA